MTASLLIPNRIDYVEGNTTGIMNLPLSIGHFHTHLQCNFDNAKMDICPAGHYKIYNENPSLMHSYGLDKSVVDN